MMFIASIRKGSVLDRAWRNHARRSAVLGGVTFNLTPAGYVSAALDAGALTAHPVISAVAGIAPPTVQATQPDPVAESPAGLDVTSIDVNDVPVADEAPTPDALMPEPLSAGDLDDALARTLAAKPATLRKSKRSPRSGR
jgi:hypothetical protein